MLALRYLLQCARQAQKPLVICFGLGTNQGDHSGYMPLAEALDTISRMNTVYVVSAAGNEAGRGHHFYGKWKILPIIRMSRYLSRKMREDLPWNFGLRRRICLQSA